jgi:hypothetical protein
VQHFTYPPGFKLAWICLLKGLVYRKMLDLIPSLCLQGPEAGEDTRLHSLSDRIFLERINLAHMRASQQLLDVLLQKVRLRWTRSQGIPQSLRVPHCTLPSLLSFMSLNKGQSVPPISLEACRQCLSKPPSHISLQVSCDKLHRPERRICSRVLQGTRRPAWSLMACVVGFCRRI